ncbi:MAG TPA: HAD hydrolase family protein [Gemmatimonadales bacterium]
MNRPFIAPAVARRIRLVVLDVDGVLTDGGIYLGAVDGARTELKRYDIQDGLGIHFLREAGLRVAIITGRVSDSVRMRAEELGVDDLVQDRHARKLPALRAMLERLDIALEETAFVGDDFPDLGPMRAVGLPVAVANAAPEIAAACPVRLTRHGGHGAVREFVELLLKARGEWDEVVERYVASRSDVELTAGATGASA